MAGAHNFKVFDQGNANMTPDSSYDSDVNRLNGVSEGVADPLSFNKAVHQATIMAAAIAQFVANQGITVDDTNLTNLVSALTSSIVSGSGISYADRVAHGLFSAADIGAISFCPAQGTPAAAAYAVGTTGNLLGGYHYREVLITGYKNPDGTYFVRGFSPAASRSSYDVSPSSQQVQITNLPLGSVGCIGRAIYRSAANGAAGTEKFCGVIWDNSTTVFTDNLVDSQLGTGMPSVQGTPIPADVPTANSTGTNFPIQQAGGIPASASCNKNWNWSGQNGQPGWLWGGNDPTNEYVYNPSNFNVAAVGGYSFEDSNVDPASILPNGRVHFTWG